jgi:hexosaminidase
MADYHMNWLGFEGTDMEAVIDLSDLHDIGEISTDFLQAVISWVFLPLTVEYSLSEDGKDFTTVALLKNTVDEKAGDMFIHSFTAAFKPVRARFVRVRARNRKICPDWHKGAGGPAWIFADEIVVR